MTSTNNIKLTKREAAVLMGFLNDAFGYPYNDYLNGVVEHKDDFNKLFGIVDKEHVVHENDAELALLALKQAYRFMDDSTLIALHDDVTRKEISELIQKFAN